MEKVIKLKFPFQFEGKTIDEIKIRPAKVKEAKEAEKKFKNNNLEMRIYLLSKISGLPMEAIEEMTEVDFLRVVEAYDDFLTTG